MKKRSARIYYVSFLLVILGFVLYAFVKTFNENLLYYRSPTQLVNGNFPDNYIFRIGGMVEEGSLIRVSGTKKVSFNVTDFSKVTFVAATGIPADQLPAVDHLSSTAPVKLDAAWENDRTE